LHYQQQSSGQTCQQDEFCIQQKRGQKENSSGLVTDLVDMSAAGSCAGVENGKAKQKQ
jgi:hypothetical protein